MSDEWQTNSSLSDTQRTQHGQPGLEVKTARAVNSPGWQKTSETEQVCVSERHVGECSAGGVKERNSSRQSSNKKKKPVTLLSSNYM